MAVRQTVTSYSIPRQLYDIFKIKCAKYGERSKIVSRLVTALLNEQLYDQHGNKLFASSLLHTSVGLQSNQQKLNQNPVPFRQWQQP